MPPKLLALHCRHVGSIQVRQYKHDSRLYLPKNVSLKERTLGIKSRIWGRIEGRSWASPRGGSLLKCIRDVDSQIFKVLICNDRWGWLGYAALHGSFRRRSLKRVSLDRSIWLDSSSPPSSSNKQTSLNIYFLAGIAKDRDTEGQVVNAATRRVSSPSLPTSSMIMSTSSCGNGVQAMIVVRE